jgi:hypothetical protein
MKEITMIIQTVFLVLILAVLVMILQFMTSPFFFSCGKSVHPVTEEPQWECGTFTKDLKIKQYE